MAKQDTTNHTTPSQFRLPDDTLADLDLIKAWLESEHGQPATRTNAIRYAARQICLQIQKKKKKS